MEAASSSTAAVPSIRIRSYTPADHAAVVALYVTGVMAYRALAKTDDALPFYVKKSLAQDMADDGSACVQATYFDRGGHFWVATAVGKRGDETVVACIAIERKENGRGELRRMAVHDAYRRLGLARRLVVHLETWAIENGIHLVFLSTGAEMAPPIRLYKAVGFAVTHKYAPENEPDARLVFFEKELLGEEH